MTTPVFRILVTGGRDHKDPVIVRQSLEAMYKQAIMRGEKVIVVHGACPTGADAYTHEWCLGKAVAMQRHPALWHLQGKAAGPIRNQEMVNAITATYEGVKGAVCLAFPTKPYEAGGGTWDCMKRAAAAGILVMNMTARDIFTLPNKELT